MLLEKDGRPVKYATLLSGGADSTVMLYDLLPVPQVAIIVDYGQTHVKEVESAKRSCKKIGIESVVIKIEGLTGSSLTGSKNGFSGNDTVVPGRNMMLIAAACNVAISKGCCRLAIGCNANDHETYLDCRRCFLQSLSESVAMSTGIRLCFPFINKTKKEIATLGESLGVSKDDTWSCYRGKSEPCGECGACFENGISVSNS